ncbi:hypothetical protein [Streptacidiphilus fuscans]|uniref:Uncharacterized protein n=1 Tax=Streptacidiphilus fuscans TaxID=2789292 RepID=A0A931AXX0_9ACTN|nr:hypothetical protein [Streptacidiphilus fuscans]MBF9066879.1 hypothetical protein [Streptacidiphilus fuscans]
MHMGVIGHEGLSDVTEMLVRGELWRIVTGCPSHDLVGVTPLRPGPETWFAQSVVDHGGGLEILGTTAHALREEARAVHHLSSGMVLVPTLLGMVEELVAVWDGQPGTEVAEAVAEAERLGLYVHRVWPEGSARQ